MFFAVFVALCGVAFGAKTIYVDCSLGNYEDHDGSSWDKAFKTIQDGVDHAVDGDTVLVAPGWYDEGGAAIDKDSNGVELTNRVYISKQITVRSRDGRETRDSTFIVGRHATNPQDPQGLGMGLDAVRCVRFNFAKTTQGAVVEGFTLINGATHYYDNNHSAYTYSTGGGAFLDRKSVV